ncbi:MAG: hypothetical protein WBE79_08055 [Candidatus Cybelea sp.]
MFNLALGFYNVGTIWAHEIDIFRTWRLVGASFHEIQAAHWRKLPYWVFAPVVLGVVGSIVLLWYHPPGSPWWAIVGVFGCQAASTILTALYWGPWQAALSQDTRGAASPFLERILKTHWVRTALINASGLILLAWSILILR